MTAAAPKLHRDHMRVCSRGRSEMISSIGCSTCGWSALIPDVDDEGLALFGGEDLVPVHTAEDCAQRQEKWKPKG